MKSKYHWDFPLPRTHTGMLQGNGALGAMIWGERSVLCITIGMADFWDHRGGMPWTEQTSYANIRACLEKGDEAGLRKLFEATPEGEGVPRRPSVVPIGRIELDFGKDAVLRTGALELADGTVTVSVARGGKGHNVKIALDMWSNLLCVQLPDGLKLAAIGRVTAWEYVGDHLRSISFAEPQMLPCRQAGTGDKSMQGWVQQRPVDPPLCIGYRKKGRALAIATAYGPDVAGATENAADHVATALKQGFGAVRKRNRAWWKAYWKTVPAVRIPNDRLQFLYEYGMYKFAGLTNPAGVPATLQGPWIEEYQMPPWSSDYHFNINVQMCYWPAYHGNRLEHLLPLFDLIKSWEDVLRHNAKVFLGIDDGFMLPHAVDDRCTCMGGFWTGSIDHGCTAWVAQMMYRYYRYTMDDKFLKETAWPFMVGAMRVYEEMLEREGDAFVLPVSVSPEYRGARMDAWGRNASFQLACIHRLCEDLIDAAAVLGETPKPVWQEIGEKLPRACLIGPEGGEKIALWEGTPLEESHRHHSHLAGIVPFDVFDYADTEQMKVLVNSMNDWVYHGMGLWSGWCVPWAAMLNMRFNDGEAAEVLLEIWQRVFTNEGHGTLHDVHFPGISLMGRAYSITAGSGRREIMQMDAGMSCTAAIQEMMLHTRRGSLATRGVTHVFAGCPKRWKDASFGPMRTDGAFFVSAARRDGIVERVHVKSPAGGTLKLANPWSGTATVTRKGRKAEEVSGPVLEIATKPGESIEITQA